MCIDDAISCPCCGLPTLGERGGYEICIVCWWEDDGQDDRTADEVWGGPNHGYSLSQARKNFLDHGHIYESGRGIDVVEWPSDERKALLSYVHDVSQGKAELDQGTFREFISRARASGPRRPLP